MKRSGKSEGKGKCQGQEKIESKKMAYVECGTEEERNAETMNGLEAVMGEKYVVWWCRPMWSSE